MRGPAIRRRRDALSRLPIDLVERRQAPAGVRPDGTGCFGARTACTGHETARIRVGDAVSLTVNPHGDNVPV